MKTRKSHSNRNENTRIKRSPLRKFAAAALLAGYLMGCGAPAPLMRPQVSECAFDRGLRAGENAYVVLLSDGPERITGAVKLQVAKVDQSGVDFSFTLLYEGKAHDLRLRANFDGTRSGDMRVLSFFGRDEFSVSPHCGGVKVQYKETIIQGLARFQNTEPAGSCPSKMPRGTVCT
jgi:hypothetical protein